MQFTAVCVYFCLLKGIITVAVVLLLLVVIVTIVAVVIVKRKRSRFTESNGRVDWSSTFAGIEQPNEAYAPVLKRNIAYEQTKKPWGQRIDDSQAPRQQQRESMPALSQFMCTKMCCLREKQVVLTLTYSFVADFTPYNYIN